MEKKNYRIGMETAIRNIAFPYKVNAVGLSDDNPPIKSLHTFYPDKVEICLRLSGDFSNGVSVQTINGETFIPKTYPYVVVKPPKASYSLTNFGMRRVFYMIYSKDLVPELQKLDLFKQPYAWPIHLDGDLSEMLERVHRMVNVCRNDGMADRIDIQCFQILHEVLAMKNEIFSNVDHERTLMLRIESCLRRRAFKEIDFNKIAQEFGLSRSSFFRYWKRYSNVSPAQYLLDIRLDEARRRLTETRDRISDIARELCLGDPSYMGMIFRQRYGMTPLAYRKKTSLYFNLN